MMLTHLVQVFALLSTFIFNNCNIVSVERSWGSPHTAMPTSDRTCSMPSGFHSERQRPEISLSGFSHPQNQTKVYFVQHTNTLRHTSSYICLLSVVWTIKKGKRNLSNNAYTFQCLESCAPDHLLYFFPLPLPNIILYDTLQTLHTMLGSKGKFVQQ